MLSYALITQQLILLIISHYFAVSTEELVKELAKQIEYLQQHQQEHTDQVKQQVGLALFSFSVFPNCLRLLSGD